MKRIMCYLFVLFSTVSLLLVSSMTSCSKEDRRGEKEEIAIGLWGNGLTYYLETKTTELKELPSTLYWGATTGSDGEETVKWPCAEGKVVEGRIMTGKYQTGSGTKYNYYVSNAELTVGSSTTVVASNDTDVVVGRTEGSSDVNPAVELEHIFSRIGSLTLTLDGYSYSDAVWKIKGKSAINGTKGVYDLRTGTWTSALNTLTEEVTVTSDSDLYLIPGTYSVTISFKITKDGVTRSYAKSGEVTLVQGKKCNFTATPDMLNFSIEDGWDDGGDSNLNS